MIELSGITKIYQKGSQRHVALRDVSVSVGSNEAVAIVGESGAGKTTLTRILLALVKPSSGSYRYEEKDVFAMSADSLRQWRRSVQAVFQNPSASLNPRLRVAVSITEPFESSVGFDRARRRRKAAELLEMVGLSASMASRYPHQLSGGQKQRIAIARALSSNPRVLILDEPLSALDASVRGQILGLLLDLRRRLGVTYVYVTHDLATVRQLCDRVYVLYGGKVFEQGPSYDLLQKPDNPYSQVLLDSVPSLDHRRSAVQRRAPVSDGRQRQVGCAFVDRCTHAQPICFEREPVLVPLVPEWSSRCHFAGGEKPVCSDLPALKATR